MSTYENAPATKLLASNCCVCGRSLADTDSIEAGMGPKCRKDLGDVETTPDWDLVTDELGKFAAMDKSDPDRIRFFESAMSMLEPIRAKKMDDHLLSNQLTHYIAATQNRNKPMIGNLIMAIRFMGRLKLADALTSRLYSVRIRDAGPELLVRAPYDGHFSNLMYEGRIGRWNKENKCFVVPTSMKVQLFCALKTAYHGQVAMGPKGEFKL